MTTVIQTDAGSFIPASQRPDGTWRKARRVKDGYVPQEEVPLYESKGKQWANQKPLYPVGFDPEVIQKAQTPKTNEDASKAKKKKKKKKPSVEVQPAFIVEEPPGVIKHTNAQNKIEVETPKTTSQQADNTDFVKKLKSLKKKLREIETLEMKIKNKEIKTPEKEQLEKVARKSEVVAEILDLELYINED